MAAGVAAIERITESYRSKVEAAGIAPAVAAPTVRTTILSVEPLPLGSLAPSSPSYSRVRMRVDGVDGHSEVVESIMPTAQAEAVASVAGASIAAFGTTPSKARVTARLPSKIQFQVLSADSPLPVHAGAQLQEVGSGKRFQTTAPGTVGSPGFFTLPIEEVSASEPGDVTYGTPLKWLADGFATADYARLANVPAQVFNMKTTPIPSGTELRDVAGRLYVTFGLVTLTSPADMLGGTLSGLVDVVRASAAGESLEVGAELTFVTPPSGVASSAAITEKNEATVPKDAVLTRTLAGVSRSYRVLSEMKIPDTLMAIVPIAALAGGAESNLALSDTLTFAPALPGVETSANVTGVTPWAAYPEPYPTQQVGGELAWDFHVLEQRGQYICEVFTVPYGS